MTTVEKMMREAKAKVERCACGNRISPMAKRLQDPNPGLPRKCFACLISEGKVTVVCW